MLQVTLHNYNRFEFKDQVTKRHFLIWGSIPYINFLFVVPSTACIYIAILLHHKSRHLLTFFNQVIYAPPKSTLDSIRRAIGLRYTNIPIPPAQR